MNDFFEEGITKRYNSLLIDGGKFNRVPLGELKNYAQKPKNEENTTVFKQEPIEKVFEENTTFLEEEQIEEFFEKNRTFIEEEQIQEVLEENISYHDTNEDFVHVEYQIGEPLDPQDVSEYENIIYRSMRGREKLFPQCLVSQSQITSTDRGLIIDWMSRIHFKTQLTTNTLYISIGILDRVIHLTDITIDRLEILACACLFIASKSEDLIPISLSSIITCSNNSFTKNDLIKMETQVSNLIEFDISFPTSLFFLTIFLRLNGQTQITMLLARYILEVAMTSEYFIDVKPSAIAATSLMMMRFICNEEPWTEELYNYTQYSFDDLLKHFNDLYNELIQPNREQSDFIRKKYSSSPFQGVALLPIPDLNFN